MEKNFCKKCENSIPTCAIVNMPCKASIDDLLEGKNIKYQECLVCNKNAQIIEGKLKINDMCNECGLCQITCSKIEDKKEYIDYEKLEEVIFKNFEKLAILIKSLFPNMAVGQEVQVKGNCRTKRIDVCVVSNEKVYLIKVLANIDKIPLYSRSYEEVKNYYKDNIDKTIEQYCMVAKDKKEDSLRYGYPCICLKELIKQLED